MQNLKTKDALREEQMKISTPSLQQQELWDDLVQEAKREKWFRGKLSYLLHAGQLRIDDKFSQIKGQLFVCNISRQWGKSYWAVSKAIEVALSKPNARIKYGTAFHTDLVEFILPTFEIILEDCPESLKPVYKVQGSKWVFPNGSEIKLVGLDVKPNGLRGNTIDLIVLDEAGFVEKLDYIYRSIIIPATLHRPNCRIIFISTPPATPAHPFGDFIQKAELEDAYVKLTIYDNPLITEADIKRMADEMGGFNSTTFKRECLCELILDDDLALVREWKDEFAFAVPRDEYFVYYHKLVGQDLGRKDHTALVFGYYDFKRAALVIEDELTMIGPDWTTVTLKDSVLAKEKALWDELKPLRRVSDNNNPHLLTDLSSIHDMHFMAVKKESSLEQMVNRVREWVKQGRILIHPRCKMLIGCMKYGIWDQKRKEFARSKVYGHFDHFAALMYLLIHTPYHSNPIPPEHGFAAHKAWLGNIKNKGSKNSQTIAQLFGPKKSK
jgi:hypothetical protein